VSFFTLHTPPAFAFAFCQGVRNCRGPLTCEELTQEVSRLQSGSKKLPVYKVSHLKEVSRLQSGSKILPVYKVSHLPRNHGPKYDTIIHRRPPPSPQPSYFSKFLLLLGLSPFFNLCTCLSASPFTCTPERIF